MAIGLLLGAVSVYLLAVPVSWPFLAAILALLAIHYAQLGRLDRSGLLFMSTGLVWVVVFGRSIWSDLTDPAVHVLPDTWVAFGFGIGFASFGALLFALYRRSPS